MYICLCKGITDSMVRGLEQQNLGPDEIASRLGVDREDCCGRCVCKVASLAAQGSGAAARYGQAVSGNQKTFDREVMR